MLTEGYKEEKYEKAISIFYPYPLKEDFLKFHTPRNFTSRCSLSDIQILCEF